MRLTNEVQHAHTIITHNTHTHTHVHNYIEAKAYIVKNNQPRPRPTHRVHCQYNQPRPRPIRLTIIKANTQYHTTHTITKRGQGQNTYIRYVLSMGNYGQCAKILPSLRWRLAASNRHSSIFTRGVRSAHSSFL